MYQKTYGVNIKTKTVIVTNKFFSCMFCTGGSRESTKRCYERKYDPRIRISSAFPCVCLVLIMVICGQKWHKSFCQSHIFWVNVKWKERKVQGVQTYVVAAWLSVSGPYSMSRVILLKPTAAHQDFLTFFLLFPSPLTSFSLLEFLLVIIPPSLFLYRCMRVIGTVFL